MKQELRILALILLALLTGLVVLLIKPDYRFNENLLSNENYYPATTEHPNAPKASHDPSAQGTQKQSQSSGNPEEIDIQKDFEF